MSKKKLVAIIIACTIAIIVVILITTRPSGLPPLGPPGSTVSVDYEVIVDGASYLRVRVEGPEKTYKVLLFNPNVVKVGEAHIFSDDMIPGHATVEVMMAEPFENPIPGEYWLIVQDMFADKRVFEAKPVFQGPDVSITNVQFKTDYYDYYYSPHSNDPYATVEAIVHLYNGGDLPVDPDFIKLSVAGDEEQDSVWGILPHAETTVFQCSFWFDGLGKGTHPATVEIYSDGVMVDSYETQVTIE